MGAKVLGAPPKKRPKLLLGFLSPGDVRHEFMESVIHSLVNLPFPVVVQSSISGPMVSRGRNVVARLFLEEKSYTHLLFADSDMVFRAEHVQALLDVNQPIVGGLYFGIVPGFLETYATCLRYAEDGTTLSPVPREELPEEGSFKVDATGAGFMLIRREVLEALEPNEVTDWPFSTTLIGGRARGEDVTFCLRAKERGFPTYVSVDARVGHVKSIII